MARQTDTTKPKGTTKPRRTKSKDASSVNGAGKKDKKEVRFFPIYPDYQGDFVN